MLKKLRVKFICFNMIIATAMLAALLGLVFVSTKNSLETQSLQMMQTVAIASGRPGHPGEPSSAVRLPYFTLQVSDRGELAAVGGSYYDLSDRDFLQELADAAFAAGEQNGVLREYSLRFCRVPTPFGQVIVFADISSETATLKSLLKTCLIIGILGFLAFLIINIFLARWAVRPVDLAWKQQRQFVADASHELKTPLTVILTNAEMLDSPDYDEAARSQLSANILVMARQMRSLVEGLLELARADNGTTKAAMTAVDLTRLTERTLLPFEPIYFEKNLSIKSSLEPDVFIRASELHIQQLIAILMDNAQKYSDPAAEITVRLQKQGRHHCILSVENPGPAIAPEDLANIFKRFYRVDKARSRDGSYGLGLSIAESIVSLHRGKIWCESKNGRNTFFVRFPSISSSDS